MKYESNLRVIAVRLCDLPYNLELHFLDVRIIRKTARQKFEEYLKCLSGHSATGLVPGLYRNR